MRWPAPGRAPQTPPTLELTDSIQRHHQVNCPNPANRQSPAPGRSANLARLHLAMLSSSVGPAQRFVHEALGRPQAELECFQCRRSVLDSLPGDVQPLLKAVRFQCAGIAARRCVLDFPPEPPGLLHPLQVVQHCLLRLPALAMDSVSGEELLRLLPLVLVASVPGRQLLRLLALAVVAPVTSVPGLQLLQLLALAVVAPVASVPGRQLLRLLALAVVAVVASAPERQLLRVLAQELLASLAAARR